MHKEIVAVFVTTKDFDSSSATLRHVGVPPVNEKVAAREQLIAVSGVEMFARFPRSRQHRPFRIPFPDEWLEWRQWTIVGGHRGYPPLEMPINPSVFIEPGTADVAAPCGSFRSAKDQLQERREALKPEADPAARPNETETVPATYGSVQNLALRLLCRE
jgi:hypothetical protein